MQPSHVDRDSGGFCLLLTTCHMCACTEDLLGHKRKEIKKISVDRVCASEYQNKCREMNQKPLIFYDIIALTSHLLFIFQLNKLLCMIASFLHAVDCLN